MRAGGAPILAAAAALGLVVLSLSGDRGGGKKRSAGALPHGERATGWTEAPDGWRSWFPGGASWRLDNDGDYQARRPDGSPISIPDWSATARHTVSDLLPSLELASSDPWYTQALLSIAAHETGGPRGAMSLPAYGDYRPGGKMSGKTVPPGTPGALPISVGYYQFLRSTAQALGYSWDELAKSPVSNHMAALALAKTNEDVHRQDFPTLAALWGAGRVEQSASNPDWGIVSIRPSNITEYLAAWNAVGKELESRGRAVA